MSKTYSLTELDRIRNLPIEVKAWMAGLIDGEGSFIVRLQPAPPRGTRSSYWAVTVTIAMCHELTVQRIAELWNTRVNSYDKNGPKYRTVHQTHVHGLKAQVVLKTIRPYLLTRADQADVMLEMALIFDGPDTDVFEESRRALKEKLHSLKLVS